MTRISFPTPENMTEAQLEVYNAVISGPRGKIVGPLRAAIHNPELAAHWQALGSVLRYKTSLPKPLKELAILMTARRWNSQVEWTIHKGESLAVGLDEQLIDAIGSGEIPDFTNDTTGAEIYEFSRQLLLYGNVSDESYTRVMERWGETTVVELTALIGYYSMVAMTLNAHEIPMPDDLSNQLPPSPDGSLYISPAIDVPA